MSTIQIKPTGDGGGKSDWLEIVRQQVGSMRYGIVQIVVHDSQVTQIEKIERVRLDKPKNLNVMPTRNLVAQNRINRCRANFRKRRKQKNTKKQ